MMSTCVTTAWGDGAPACMPHPKLTLATQFINEQFHRELKISEIAATVHTSPFHFSRLFKKATGRTVYQYLTSVRVDRAKQLLATTDIPTADIGAAVGYESQSHFTTVFGRIAGITPAAYRRRSRGASKAIYVWNAVASRMPSTASIPTNEERAGPI
jgi:AraC-like DNA-binding protein